MNAVGIDVSKGRSTVAVMRPFGEVAVSPFEVVHTASELGSLAKLLKSLKGETKIVMECTGAYHLPVAHTLHRAGLSVSAVNPQLTHDFGNNTIRKSRNDKLDSVKIANYALANWLDLPKYQPETEIRQSLKLHSRQYNHYNKIKTMLKNNLISLLDQTFPGLNNLFTSPARESDGHEKWLDFTEHFWHCECVSSLSLKVFTERYRKWCKRSGYYCVGADEVHALARSCVAVMPKSESIKSLITQAAKQVNFIAETLAATAREMKRLASMLPEYDVAMEFYGVGGILAPQLMAEIGDVYNYTKEIIACALCGVRAGGKQFRRFPW